MHQSKGPLYCFLRLKWVKVGKSGQFREVFVDLWVVFHRAGAERVKAAIHMVVKTGKTDEMTDDFIFTDFWKCWGLRTE